MYKLNLWTEYILRVRQATKKKKKFPGLKRSKKDEKKQALAQLKVLIQSDHTDGANVPDSGSDSDDHESPRASPKPSNLERKK